MRDLKHWNFIAVVGSRRLADRFPSTKNIQSVGLLEGNRSALFIFCLQLISMMLCGFYFQLLQGEGAQALLHCAGQSSMIGIFVSVVLLAHAPALGGANVSAQVILLVWPFVRV